MITPEEGNAYKLEPIKEVVRKVLRYHKADPERWLDYITTEMTNLPDYGYNAVCPRRLGGD